MKILTEEEMVKSYKLPCTNGMGPIHASRLYNSHEELRRQLKQRTEQLNEESAYAEGLRNKLKEVTHE